MGDFVHPMSADDLAPPVSWFVGAAGATMYWGLDDPIAELGVGDFVCWIGRVIAWVRRLYVGRWPAYDGRR